jgi:hypothetical protein
VVTNPQHQQSNLKTGPKLKQTGDQEIKGGMASIPPHGILLLSLWLGHPASFECHHLDRSLYHFSSPIRYWNVMLANGIISAEKVTSYFSQMAASK